MFKAASRIFLGMSIKDKILFIIMITSGVALFVTFGGFMAYSSKETRDSMVQKLEVLSEVIGISSVGAISFYDVPRAENLLSTLHDAQKTVQIACIYNADGEEFAFYKKEKKSDEKCPTKLVYGSYFDDDNLYMLQEIIHDSEQFGSEKIGSIYIRSDLSEVKERFIKYVSYALLSILLGAFIAHFVSIKLLKVVSDPITSLVKTARNVSENYNYSIRAEKVVVDDELGVLVDAFNEMLFQIHERDKEVMATKEGLELCVIRRTHALEKAKKAAEKANMAKSSFLANMSHELRTPMHAILSFANFGIDEIGEATEEELLMYFSRIRDSGDRLLSLLNNLLDLSKLESGKMEYNMRKSDIIKPIDTVLSELQPLIDEKNLKFAVNNPDFSMITTFDMGKIVQVVYNLFSNAIKFSPEKGGITVDFVMDSMSFKGDENVIDAITVIIKDQGVGIPEDELEKIFDKFIQSSKMKTGAGGTGLGLAISMEIIKGHKGKIWCNNYDDNNGTSGAAFSFMLPVI